MEAAPGKHPLSTTLMGNKVPLGKISPLYKATKYRISTRCRIYVGIHFGQIAVENQLYFQEDLKEKAISEKDI